MFFLIYSAYAPNILKPRPILWMLTANVRTDGCPATISRNVPAVE